MPDEKMLYTSEDFERNRPPDVLLNVLSLKHLEELPLPLGHYVVAEPPDGRITWACLVPLEGGGGIAVPNVGSDHPGNEIPIRYVYRNDSRGFGYEAEIRNSGRTATRNDGEVQISIMAPLMHIERAITEKICLSAGIPAYIPLVSSSSFVRLPIPPCVTAHPWAVPGGGYLAHVYSKGLIPGDAHKEWQKFIAQDPFAPKK